MLPVQYQSVRRLPGLHPAVGERASFYDQSDRL